MIHGGFAQRLVGTGQRVKHRFGKGRCVGTRIKPDDRLWQLRKPCLVTGKTAPRVLRLVIAHRPFQKPPMRRMQVAAGRDPVAETAAFAGSETGKTGRLRQRQKDDVRHMPHHLCAPTVERSGQNPIRARQEQLFHQPQALFHRPGRTKRRIGRKPIEVIRIECLAAKTVGQSTRQGRGATSAATRYVDAPHQFRSGDVDADRAGHTGAAYAAVSAGVLGKILLMVVLGEIESSARR